MLSLLLYDLIEPSFLHLNVDIVLVFFLGKRSGSFRVKKHVREIELNLVHQRKRLTMLVFCFGTESGDHIGRNSAILAKDLTNAIDLIQVPLARVSTIHHFKNT